MAGANLHIGIGALLRQRGDFAGAISSAQNALDQLRRERRRAMIAHAAGLVGEILRESGKLEEATAFYREAIEQIEFVRSSLVSKDHREWYFSDWMEVYNGIIGALWQTGSTVRPLTLASGRGRVVFSICSGPKCSLRDKQAM
jgi:hypothetical protein